LTYECFFYFSLPVIAIILGVKSGAFYLIFGLLSVGVVIFWWKPEIYYLLMFLVGILTNYFSSSEKLKVICQHNMTSILAIGSLISLELFSDIHTFISVICLSIFFIIVACGNDLFGLLRHKASIVLGEISYSIYLLHGIMLWVTFKLIIGEQASRKFTAFEHWSILIGCSPILIVLSYLTFRWIEKPSINMTVYATQYIRTAIGFDKITEYK
jgi:peptidoglycan/LPS O-acetylase OafA/YrhL